MGLIELYSIDVLNQFVFTECISFGIYSFSSNVFFTKFRRNAFGLDSIITKPLPTSVAVTRRSKKKTKVWKISTPNEKKNGTNPSSPSPHPPTHSPTHPKKKMSAVKTWLHCFTFDIYPASSTGQNAAKKRTKKGKVCATPSFSGSTDGFTGFQCVFFLNLNGFDWVSWAWTRLEWVLLGLNGFYWMFLSFARFCWFFKGFTEFYWVLLGFTGFLRDITGFHGNLRDLNCFYWTWLGFTEFYWVL